MWVQAWILLNCVTVWRAMITLVNGRTRNLTNSKMTRGTARARPQRVSLWFSTVKHQGAHWHWCTKGLSAATAIEDQGLVCCCLTSAVVPIFFWFIFLADRFPTKIAGDLPSEGTSTRCQTYVTSQLAVKHMSLVDQGKANRTACTPCVAA